LNGRLRFPVTYKLKWPASDHAIYVTLNDIEVGGRRRPFEIFINTRNLEHYAWTVALTRMISAVFRRGGDVTFVAEELKAVFDPQGGQWIGGRYVPSLLAAIGDVIERHMIETGFIDGAGTSGAGLFVNERPGEEPTLDVVQIQKLGDTGHALDSPANAAMSANTGSASSAARGADTRGAHTLVADTSGLPTASAVLRTPGVHRQVRPPPTRFCQRCSSPNLALVEGCWTCRDCSFSKCG